MFDEYWEEFWVIVGMGYKVIDDVMCDYDFELVLIELCKVMVVYVVEVDIGC